MNDEQVAETGRMRLSIPVGTYAGQDSGIFTTSLPVVAHTTTAMEDDTANALTAAIWQGREEMAATSLG